MARIEIDAFPSELNLHLWLGFSMATVVLPMDRPEKCGVLLGSLRNRLRWQRVGCSNEPETEMVAIDGAWMARLYRGIPWV